MCSHNTNKGNTDSESCDASQSVYEPNQGMCNYCTCAVLVQTQAKKSHLLFYLALLTLMLLTFLVCVNSALQL